MLQPAEDQSEYAASILSRRARLGRSTLEWPHRSLLSGPTEKSAGAIGDSSLLIQAPPGLGWLATRRAAYGTFVMARWIVGVSAGACRFPRPAGAARYSPPVPCTFLIHLRGGIRRFFGGRQEGSGEPGTGAVFFRGRGGSEFPSAFPDWSPLLSVYSCSRAIVFLTSLCLLFEGVRSGTRRRRGASASAQAGGGIGPETRRTAPARAGAVLYGRCAITVWMPRGPEWAGDWEARAIQVP